MEIENIDEVKIILEDSLADNVATYFAHKDERLNAIYTELKPKSGYYVLNQDYSDERVKIERKRIRKKYHIFKNEDIVKCYTDAVRSYFFRIF